MTNKFDLFIIGAGSGGLGQQELLLKKDESGYC